jgi:hypothetical protein
MGVVDRGEFRQVSRIAEARSIQRAVTASVLARIGDTTPEKVLKAHWPRINFYQLLSTENSGRPSFEVATGV